MPCSGCSPLYEVNLNLKKSIDDVIDDQTCSSYFHEKFESIQYNVWVAIPGVIRDTSTEKLYQKLELGSLKGYLCYKIIFCNKVAFDVDV